MKDKISYIPETWTHANSYIIHGEKDYLIDPSIPFDESIGKKLNVILATHFHYDHISQVEIWREKTGLNFWMPEKSRPLLNDPQANCSMMFGNPQSFSEADHYYQDETTIDLEPNFRLKSFHLPGHSPGSSSLLVEFRKEDIFEPLALISGDVLFSNSIGRTDLKGGNHSEMIKSLKRLIKIMRKLPDDLIILPGHGSPFTIRDAFQYNPYILQLE